MSKAQTEKEKRLIEFKYIFSDDYRPDYTNGAYGGVTTTGDICANFFLERMPVPRSQLYVCNDEDGLSNILEPVEPVEPEDFGIVLIRHVPSGIVMHVEAARNLVDWLNLRIAEAEAFNKTKGKVDYSFIDHSERK